jgi:creatinine amidohydrolase/Fe(II)-dependent formamide hydrolase-like protein
VDFDTWFVDALMQAAAEKAFQDYMVHTLVLPAIPFGPTPEHKGYGSGYVHIPKDLHEALGGRAARLRPHRAHRDLQAQPAIRSACRSPA